jgi:hypothetical protein
VTKDKKKNFSHCPLSLVSFMSLVSFFLLSFFLLSFISPLIAKEKSKKPKYDLVICALFRNEELYMKEWIEFHKLMGVQHFYLYDNGSTDRSLEILKPYIKSKLVDLFSWPREANTQGEYLHSLQLPIYRDALEIVKRKAKWAAFIDIDEFLFPVQEADLVTLLKKYSQYGGLVANWQMFGTSNRDHLNPGELLIEALIWKTPLASDSHHFIKSIVQPRKVKEILDPHSFHYIDGYYAVNSSGEPAIPGIGKHPSIVVDTVRINHYWFGTREWFLIRKVPLKIKWGFLSNPTPEGLEYFMLQSNVEKDESILRFAPALRKAMSLSKKK